MANIDSIAGDFREKVCAELSLRSEGVDRYRVLTPFRFEDGDHLSIVLRQENGRWVLSDEGHTYMHLTYDIDERDLREGGRQQIISNALSVFGVADEMGELRIDMKDGQHGDALFNFIQALLKITDVAFLSRERVSSTFVEDFRRLMTETIADDRRQFDWNDPERDPEAKYTVSCRANGRKSPLPLFIYALQNDGQTQTATITLHQFEKWGLRSRSVALFENQEEISRRVLARFSDVCDKQYSNIGGNHDRITRYLQEITSE